MAQQGSLKYRKALDTELKHSRGDRWWEDNQLVQYLRTFVEDEEDHHHHHQQQQQEQEHEKQAHLAAAKQQIGSGALKWYGMRILVDANLIRQVFEMQSCEKQDSGAAAAAAATAADALLDRSYALGMLAKGRTAADLIAMARRNKNRVQAAWFEDVTKHRLKLLALVLTAQASSVYIPLHILGAYLRSLEKEAPWATLVVQLLTTQEQKKKSVEQYNRLLQRMLGYCCILGCSLRGWIYPASLAVDRRGVLLWLRSVALHRPFVANLIRNGEREFLRKALVPEEFQAFMEHKALPADEVEEEETQSGDDGDEDEVEVQLAGAASGLGCRAALTAADNVSQQQQQQQQQQQPVPLRPLLSFVMAQDERQHQQQKRASFSDAQQQQQQQQQRSVRSRLDPQLAMTPAVTHNTGVTPAALATVVVARALHAHSSTQLSFRALLNHLGLELIQASKQSDEQLTQLLIQWFERKQPTELLEAQHEQLKEEYVKKLHECKHLQAQVENFKEQIAMCRRLLETSPQHQL